MSAFGSNTPANRFFVSKMKSTTQSYAVNFPKMCTFIVVSHLPHQLCGITDFQLNF